MNGLGFLIWQLAAMPPVDEVIAALRAMDVNWVSIKIADGTRKYNQVGGNDKALLAFIGTLDNAGFEVGGWHYIYPQQPGPQGDLAQERFEKLGLKHLLVNAEGEWKQQGLGDEAQLYMDKTPGNDWFIAGLCSYRYPSYHAPFPFPKFINHGRNDIIAPQVYWIGAHNPASQVRQSLADYKKIVPGGSKPFVPIGSTFDARMPDGSIWSPTTDDLTEFLTECRTQGFKAYGFYSLDWIFTYDRTDWIAAIAGSTPPPPPQANKVQVISPMNVRNMPAVAPGTDIGDLHKDAILTTLEDQGDWYKIEAYVWKRGVKPV